MSGASNNKKYGCRGSVGKPDFLLFSPPPWLVQGPPLGLAALSAYLRMRGWRIAVMDGNARLFHAADEAERGLWKWDRSAWWENETEVEKKFGNRLRTMADEIVATGVENIGINIVTRKEATAAILLRRLKELKSGLRIYIGGPGAGWRDSRDRIREIAGGLFEGFIVGEGEQACDELLQRLRDDREIDGMPGFVSAETDGESRYRPAAYITDMDALPVPDFSDFIASDYEGGSLVVEWNRGCVAKCTYCSVNDFWNVFRYKTASRVATELEILQERYGADLFTIADPMVNGDPGALEAICDEIQKRRIKIRWNAGISPNRKIDAGLFRKMATAGCRRLEFGVDSGSDAMLRKMGKKYRAADAGKMIDDAHDAGIDTMLYLIVGFPGETDDTLHETLCWLETHAASIDGVRSVSGLTIEDGTAVSEKPGAFGIDEADAENAHWKDDWTAGEETPEKRGERVRRIYEKMTELGITKDAQLEMSPTRSGSENERGERFHCGYHRTDAFEPPPE